MKIMLEHTTQTGAQIVLARCVFSASGACWLVLKHWKNGTTRAEPYSDLLAALATFIGFANA